MAVTITLDSGQKLTTATNRAYVLIGEHPGQKPYVAKRSNDPGVLRKELQRLRNKGVGHTRFTLASTVTKATWPV